MSSAYRLIYRRVVLKFLVKQEKLVQERISIGIRGLLEDSPLGDIKPMKGRAGLYRLRLGTLRILFRMDQQEKVIFVEAIGSRGDVYK